MLELIFQGFVEWIYGMVLESWEFFCDTLLDIMSLDFAYMQTHIPVINDIMQVLLAVGWALLLGNLVFQAIRSMLSGLGFEAEDPKLLFARTFVFSFLLLASPQICEMGLSMTSTIMELLQVPDAVNVQLVDDSLFGNLSAAWALVIIFDLLLMFKVLKLLLEIAERYVILTMLTITAPLAFATGGSRNTTDIFSGWSRMYGSMCLLMCVNVIFFKMLLSVVSTVPSGLDVVPWMVLILAIVKVAKKADAIITRIGLNPAITGDNMGTRLPGMLTYAVVRTMTSNITKAAKKSAGGTNRGRGLGFSPGGGGGPKSSGPFGGYGRGGNGTTTGATSQSTTQQPGAGQSHQSNTQTGPQQSTVQTTGQQPAAKGQAGSGATFSTTDQFGQMGRSPSRKSSVPSGTHRSPSHVKAPMGSPAPGASTHGTPTPGKSNEQAQPVAGATYIAGHITQDQAHPGTAGTPSQGGVPLHPGGSQPGTAGKGVPGGVTRFTQASSQRVQSSGTTGKVQTTEQSDISTGQQQKAARTGRQPPGVGVGSGQKGQTDQGVTRLSQREKLEKHTPAPSATVQTPPVSTGVQPGMAGTGASPTADHSTRMTRHGRNVPPVSGAAPKPQAPSSPARQEPHESSDTITPQIKGSTIQPRPGTAGTAATPKQAAQTQQTARPEALREKSMSASGGKPAMPASTVGKGQFAPKGTTTPKVQQSTRKRADRPPRKGGTEHGK